MSGNICAATNSPSPCSKATTTSSTNPAPRGASSPTTPNASPQSHPEPGRRSFLEAVGISRALFSSYCIAIDVIGTRHVSAAQRIPCDSFKVRSLGDFSMSLDSDVIVDRRRIRRKLTFWRVVAALAGIAAIATIGVVATPGGRSALATTGSIARVNIDGLIRSDNDRVDALERLEKSQAAAVVVHINSPGGTTAGSEPLYH